ncbi:MAG: hypothetical protein ACLU9O_09990, partial [Roseburia hominis]
LWDARDHGTGYWLLFVCRVCICVAIAVQVSYDLRLTVTDEMRCREDEQKTQQLLECLAGADGGELPRLPVVFVGYQEADLPEWCRRTEMYGWSFYGWDYSMENPTGTTHRICGFVQAYTGNVLREDATEEQKKRAVELAGQMNDFPEEGSVLVTEDCVVVRLSEIKEQMRTDWW